MSSDPGDSSEAVGEGIDGRNLKKMASGQAASQLYEEFRGRMGQREAQNEL